MLIYLQMLELPEERVKFESLYQTHRKAMFHIAKRILQDESLAEDAVHQAFVNIIAHFDQLMRYDDQQLYAYLFVTTQHAAIDLLRERKKVPLERWESTDSLETPFHSNDEIANALSRLPERYRTALLLRYRYGYTPKEVASFFGINLYAEKKLIWRAKKALKKMLWEEDAIG